MQRKYELVDLMVALGLFATIVAGGLVFMVANGTLSVLPREQRASEQPIGTVDGMRWLQPVLGQAILDQDMLEGRNQKAAPAAVKHLNGVTAEYRRWQTSPFGYLELIKTSAAEGRANHAARVQAVMGRAIVHFTQRGIRSGVLPPGPQVSDYNARMISATDAWGRQMDAAFSANWQSNLGRAILVATQDRADASALMQERLGGAIAQLATIQTTYEGKRAAIQEQLAAATVAAGRTEWQRHVSVGAGAVPSAQEPVLLAPAQRAWPEISSGYMVAASATLMGLFLTGLLFLSTLPLRRIATAEQ